MVWLKSPLSQLSKTFENRLNIKKVMGWNVWMCFDSSINSLTNTAFNALCALIFISTVSTNKIPYSIHNSIALIFCIDCLDMPFNVHSNYNVDSNTKYIHTFLLITFLIFNQFSIPKSFEKLRL